ncbi:calcium-translocating P-type ATPase, PMCA-type family protein [Tritrichomonas foetus]|uniref:Calcium-transporting ATPase n=1 Tax=Tritrichomonas foetus TaxID=1144522 RepID=A0A1J4KKE8_9EUKA|nr:calcium-translocating P-type ATPase, PMCA-type family protein [Tritrichomonas foetus]|eukprot:OHT11400.1 calcium-translocating P-type ATPase, PMCA-type family protein [Tritrichomonas foetus]
MEDCDLHTLHELGSIDDIANLLDSDSKNGIKSKDSISLRKSRYGSNVLPDIPVRSFWQMFKEALSDETLLILIGCAIFSLVFEILFATTEERSTAWIDGAAILMAVAIVSIVQTTSNRNQEIQFAAVNRIKSLFEVTVIRCGKYEKIQNSELVVGDVVVLEPGDKIPADCLVVSSDGLKIDQSVASGESESVMKNRENDPFLISGTMVVEGRGTCLVVCVGVYSINGRMFSLLDSEQKPTPLQEKLEDLASSIGYLGMIAAAITFIALTIGWIIIHIKEGFTWVACKDILTYLIDALTIIVVAVPEGLPLAVTISLAYSMRQMMDDNNFVRRLSACETMGSATVICTDKTGTLTMNQMNAERIVSLDRSEEAIDSTAEQVKTVFDPEFVQKVVDSISLNTTAVLKSNESNSDIGSQTETALLRLVQQQLGFDYSEIRKSHSIVKDFQFDRKRKLMTTIVSSQSGNTDYVQYTKGAPDELLPRCSHFLDSTSGEKFPITQKARESITKAINQHCTNAYRAIAVCMKDEIMNLPEEASQAEEYLTFVCCVSIRDSLRPSTIQAINDCQRAGIRVIMVTGDNLLTAQAIAHDCGIAPKGGSVVSGSELRAMDDAKLSEAVSDVCVVARSTPMDKHLIVSALQKRGEVVAVTGDGTNDAAALRKADVGLSMGKCGTELAKEASDIVVLDDDFKSIVKAVLWGRCIFNNVRRFLQFQLTANVTTLFISIISSIILNDTPFKAVQLLWVNLIMDSLGALALATGRPHPNLLNRPPKTRKSHLISPFMITNICGQAVFQIIVVVFLLIFHDGIEARSEHHYTLIFNVFVYCQMFNLINARVVEYGDSFITGIMDNVLFIGIMIGIGVVEFVLVQFCGHFFSCVPLSMKEQIFSLAIASLCVPFGIIVRKTPENIFSKLIRSVKRMTISSQKLD